MPQTVQEVNWVNKYGKIFVTYMGTTPLLNVADPKLIRDILVKDFHLFTNRDRKNRPRDEIMSKNLGDAKGDDWKRIRSIISPSFSSGKMKRMYPLIRQSLKDFLDHLDGMAANKQNVNLKDLYGNYTMDVISMCAFGTKTNIHEELDNPFVVNARKVFNFNLLRIALTFILPNFILKYLNRLIWTNEAQEALDFFVGTTKKILETRKTSDNKFNDFIQLMIEAETGPDDALRDDNDCTELHHVNQGRATSGIANGGNRLNPPVVEKMANPLSSQGGPPPIRRRQILKVFQGNISGVFGFNHNKELDLV